MFDDLSSEVINLVCFVFVVLSSTPVTNPVSLCNDECWFLCIGEFVSPSNRLDLTVERGYVSEEC